MIIIFIEGFQRSNWESVGALADAVKAGRLVTVVSQNVHLKPLESPCEHKICAVQSGCRYGLATKYKVIQRCKELGMVCTFSPLGRAFLSGWLEIWTNLKRRYAPFYARFSGSKFVSNLKLVDDLAAIAKDNNYVSAVGAGMGFIRFLISFRSPERSV